MDWLNELIDRYSQPKREFYKPRGFQFNRQPFDPSDYYRDLEGIKEINRLGTEQELQRAETRKQRQKAQIPLISANVSAFTRSDLTGEGNLGRPLGNYNVSSGYGQRQHPITGGLKFHTGIDLAVAEGTPIYATHSGVVQTSGVQGGYGNLVVLGGANGLQTYYAHQSRMAVKVGEYIQQGQLVGYVGSTGMSTGPHLHYEVRMNGRHVNPASYL
jgi:murein DD-endopeptidase MepM/ murein hydrolase activator NlpD